MKHRDHSGTDIDFAKMQCTSVVCKMQTLVVAQYHDSPPPPQFDKKLWGTYNFFLMQRLISIWIKENSFAPSGVQTLTT